MRRLSLVLTFVASLGLVTADDYNANPEMDIGNDDTAPEDIYDVLLLNIKYMRMSLDERRGMLRDNMNMLRNGTYCENQHFSTFLLSRFLFKKSRLPRFTYVIMVLFFSRVITYTYLIV